AERQASSWVDATAAASAALAGRTSIRVVLMVLIKASRRAVFEVYPYTSVKLWILRISFAPSPYRKRTGRCLKRHCADGRLGIPIQTGKRARPHSRKNALD